MTLQYLYLVCQGAGLTMILGTIFLLFREKIFLDAETKRVLYVELPLLGKMKTNTPTLALFVLGLCAVLYPPYIARTQYLKVRQKISSNMHPVAVYVAVRADLIPDNMEMQLSLPILSDQDYDPKIIYVAGTITNSFDIDLKTQHNGVIVLPPQWIQDHTDFPASSIKVDVAPKPEGFK